MLRELLTRFRARLLACPEPEFETPERAVYDDLRSLIDKPQVEPDWSCAQCCELHLSRLIPASEIGPELDRRLAILEGLAPGPHKALSARWKGIAEAAAEAGQGTLDVPAARALLVATQEEVQWHSTREYLIRKLGVAYAAKLIRVLLIAILIGFTLVIWEVYYPSWPLGETRFSGFRLALVAGLLGAIFSALTNQRTVTKLTNLEEVSNAIGLPMILLRLGVGASAAAILYFFFEAGLVEGVIFPDLNAIGFDPVLLTTIDSANGDSVTISLGMLHQNIADARTAASQAAETLANVVDGTTDAGRAAATAAEDISILDNALESAESELAGTRSRELGRYVPSSDLSKLVVWSFLAGFSEKLVPSILGKIKNTTSDR